MTGFDLRYHGAMLRRLFRFLLWISITVLSFQGSAAMAFGQHDHVHVVTMAASHHQDAGHCHESDGKAPAIAHAKCATCPGCCPGAAAPPALAPVLQLPATAGSPRALPQAAITSFIPATLERPPRSQSV